MSLQTLICLNIQDLNLSEVLARINKALNTCDSVNGLFAIRRLSGPDYDTMEPTTILDSAEGSYLSDSQLAAVQLEIDNSTEGFEAEWEVTRYWPDGSRRKLQSHCLMLKFEPPTHRPYTLSTIGESYFIDAGSQRFFLPSAMEDPLAAEAAARNLELLVDEIALIATVPTREIKGIPIHSLDPDEATPLKLTWLYFDGCLHTQEGDSLGIRNTMRGPIYYSPYGPLGNLEMLDLIDNLSEKSV